MEHHKYFRCIFVAKSKRNLFFISLFKIDLRMKTVYEKPAKLKATLITSKQPRSGYFLFLLFF